MMMLISINRNSSIPQQWSQLKQIHDRQLPAAR